MTAAFILALCLGITAITLWRPNYAMAIIAGGAWFGLLAYTRDVPLAGMTAGSTTDSIFVILYAGAAIIIPIITILRVRTSNRYNKEYGVDMTITSGRVPEKKAGNNLAQERSNRHGWGQDYDDSPEAYQARIRHILRPSKRRR